MSYVITKVVVLSDYDSGYIFETIVLCRSICIFSRAYIKKHHLHIKSIDLDLGDDEYAYTFHHLYPTVKQTI